MKHIKKFNEGLEDYIIDGERNDERNDDSDNLILLERKYPTKYEIHRGSIEQTKNLVLTTNDKKFAERLVNGYNSYK